MMLALDISRQFTVSNAYIWPDISATITAKGPQYVCLMHLRSPNFDTVERNFLPDGKMFILAMDVVCGGGVSRPWYSGIALLYSRNGIDNSDAAETRS